MDKSTRRREWEKKARARDSRKKQSQDYDGGGEWSPKKKRGSKVSIIVGNKSFLFRGPSVVGLQVASCGGETKKEGKN